MLLRPYGVVVEGRLELGLEVLVENGVIREVRPHTGIPEPYVLSPAFVNAHSHLEYRGFMGRVAGEDYWSWIREITRMKPTQTLEEVHADAMLAARENRRTGVSLIAEHSDRPGSAAAMREAGLEGVIFQEVITFLEQENPAEKLESAKRRLDASVGVGVPSYLNPHAFHTVDLGTLRNMAAQGTPISIHAAETPAENELTIRGAGVIADFYRSFGFEPPVTGRTLVESLDDLALVRTDVQLVHCCDVSESDLDLIAERGASVAHCPRSNAALGCPAAPVWEMLERGIRVGLGMDSAASSGPVDMFEEMRAALRVALGRGRPLTPERVWWMATGGGAHSLLNLVAGPDPWDIARGSTVPLLALEISDAECTEDLILRGNPAQVRWIGES